MNKEFSSIDLEYYLGMLKSGLSRLLSQQDIGLPVLISGNIKNGNLNYSELKYWYLKDPQGANTDNYILDEGDILLCFINSIEQIGKLAMFKGFDRPCIYTTNLFRIKTKVGNDPNFLYYLLSSRFVQDGIKLITKPAVNQASFTTVEFQRIQVPYIGFKNQKKIAQILSTCDTVLEKTEAAIAKYQALKQGLMHDLFTRGIDIDTGQLRPSYKEAPELYKESKLGFVPRDWKVRDLISVTTLITDGAHFSPTPQDKGLPIGNVKDIRNGSLDYDKCTKILPDVFEDLKRQNCSPKLDDVLLSKDGTIGRVVHFTDSRPIVLLSSIAIIRPNELVFPGYLANILKSEFFDKALYKLLSGSALKRITLRDIQKIKMPYPKDVEEQKVTAIRLNSIDQKIQTEQHALEKYKKLKAGLMQDLLSGKVGVEGLLNNTNNIK